MVRREDERARRAPDDRTSTWRSTCSSSTETKKWDAWTEEDAQANREGHERFQALAGDAILGGKELARTRASRTVRSDHTGARVVSDGPFAETKEVLGGYYVIEAPDLDAAVELAAELPEVAAGHSGVEVRPVV
jgi:hypothetical protein